MSSLDQLKQTLAEAVATGKPGTPVAARLALQLPDAEADLAAAAAALLDLVDGLLRLRPGRLSSRVDPAGRQANLLLAADGGATLSLTVGRGSVDRSTLDLLLLGNRGIVRLEGAELFETLGDGEFSDASKWRSAVSECLEASGPISV